jgi:site-specific recombinase XerD
MLEELFPRVHDKYRSLPILGSTLDGLAAWLVQGGYPQGCVRRQIRATPRIECALQNQGVDVLHDVDREQLRACTPDRAVDAPDLAAAVRTLVRYLDELGFFPAPDPPGRIEAKLEDYRTYLEEVRGLASSTLAQHLRTASQFLRHLEFEAAPSRLAALAPGDIESFVRAAGVRLSRESLQHQVAHLRSFLRFLATRGETPSGLETQIDTPRVYRGERLPRALPWETVRALLDSIDRSTPIGRRDYAILLLIATYGLRAGEIVALTLDDVEWRAGRIRIVQRKTDTPLLLPLTDAVGEALLEYLRHGRPALPCRMIFLRHRAPAGVLKPTAVTEIFQAWSRRSGLAIPFQGPHCLRHSYAVHLLRQGVSLKTIGDVLGHRSAESTCVYLRLAVDDLRDAALPLPQEATSGVAEGGRS